MIHAQDMVFCKRKLTTFLKINILLVGCLYVLLIRHVTQQIGPAFNNIIGNVNVSESQYSLQNLGIGFVNKNGVVLRNISAPLEIPPRYISGAKENGIKLEKNISTSAIIMKVMKNNASTTSTSTTTIATTTTTIATTTTTIATTTTTSKAHQPSTLRKATTIKPAPVKKVISEAEFYSRKNEKIHPFAHSLLIEGKQICSNDTYMMILIHSFHPYFSRRQAIRATWGSVAKGTEWPQGKNINVKISLAFTFGVHAQDAHNIKLKKESEDNGDIIQGDFKEDYKNMTLKSLLEFHWMSKYCPSAKYLLKSDDDMFINIPYLIKVLQNDTMPPKSIMGPYNRRSKVYRNSKKWGVSKTVYPFDYYPPYHSGAAYIITGDLMKEFFDTAEYVPQFHIDDVYITGILAKMLNVTHVLKYGFAYANTKRAKSCELNGEVVITSTKMTPEIMKSTWREMASCPAIPVNTTQTVPPVKKT